MKPIPIRSHIRFLPGVALISLAIASYSCISIRYPSEGKPIVLSDDTALVFGRLKVIEDNVDVTRDFCDPKSFFSSSDRLLSFTLLDLESRKVAMNVIAEDDGSFYWVLPRGYYRVINIGYRMDVDPYLAFKIESGSKYVYIGNIVIESESAIAYHVSLHRHKAGMSTEFEIKNVTIEDDFKYEANVLRERFSSEPQLVEKSLMFPNYDR